MDAPISGIYASAYCLPTPAPQSDGSAEWDSTTIVIVEVHGGGRIGNGYTYADKSAAIFIASILGPALDGADAFDGPAAVAAMRKAARNQGLSGLGIMAISAVDAALWDLRSKLLGVPLTSLLGRSRRDAEVYGSGGFTSFSIGELKEQMSGWANSGFRAVKMKVGRDPEQDIARMRAVREVLPASVSLFIDANGAYTIKHAVDLVRRLPELNVTWLEEPVSSDHLDGLRLIREMAPGVEIAAGEYGYDVFYFRRMLESRSVDVLQADATRCGGISGFLQACTLAHAFGLNVSSHCAPALHVHACCCVANFAHMEWFADHVRLESIFFDGVSQPHGGTLSPPEGEGLGLVLRAADVERYRVL